MSTAAEIQLRMHESEARMEAYRADLEKALAPLNARFAALLLWRVHLMAVAEAALFQLTYQPRTE